MNNVFYASSSVTSSSSSYIPSDSAYREDTIYLKQDENLKREILDTIKEIRSDIWDENVYYASSPEDVGKTGIREIAKRSIKISHKTIRNPTPGPRKHSRKTVANVVDKLYDLMDETYYLIRKSYALLGEFENIY